MTKHDQAARGDPEQRARAINAEPWQPLPGWRKVQCSDCEFWFATNDRVPLCHDCRELARKGLSYSGRHKPSE
jgi:hypothetical protein